MNNNLFHLKNIFIFLQNRGISFSLQREENESFVANNLSAMFDTDCHLVYDEFEKYLSKHNPPISVHINIRPESIKSANVSVVIKVENSDETSLSQTQYFS